MNQIQKDDNQDDDQTLRMIILLACLVLACDIFTFVTGMCMIKCHRVKLDRTLRLALGVTIGSLAIKLAHYVTLSQVDLDYPKETPSLTYVFLWITLNK